MFRGIEQETGWCLRPCVDTMMQRKEAVPLTLGSTLGHQAPRASLSFIQVAA